MPAKTDFDVSPFWDDWTLSDDFYRVLFRPGFAVQARELTTLQTILQNQIEQFGDHMFKHGAQVIPGAVTYDSQYYAVKVQSTYTTGTLSDYLGPYVGATITGATSGVTAVVVNHVYTDGTYPYTLFLKYINTSTVDNVTQTFTNDELISSSAPMTATGSSPAYAENVASAQSAHTAATASRHTGNYRCWDIGRCVGLWFRILHRLSFMTNIQIHHLIVWVGLLLKQ